MGWVGQTQLPFWRRISQSEIRNSGFAQKMFELRPKNTAKNKKSLLKLFSADINIPYYFPY